MYWLGFFCFVFLILFYGFLALAVNSLSQSNYFVAFECLLYSYFMFSAFRAADKAMEGESARW